MWPIFKSKKRKAKELRAKHSYAREKETRKLMWQKFTAQDALYPSEELLWWSNHLDDLKKMTI